MAEKKASAESVAYEKGRLYQLPIVDIKPNPATISTWSEEIGDIMKESRRFPILMSGKQGL
jgi:hypothetical protein